MTSEPSRQPAERALLQTPLTAAHRRLGARLVDFAGWEMPVQYPTGILAEHTAVREGCGLFDLSHMGRVYVRGPDALALSQWCATRDLARVPPGGAAYALLCAPDGGIVDDVIAYVLGPGELLFVFNASNREVDVQWFRDQAQEKGFSVALDDQTQETALIGVQGPRAQEALAPLASGADLDALPGYGFLQTTVAGYPTLLARTGYTGEDGFELMVRAEHSETLWEALLDSPVQPRACGLGARDTLRTEAGMSLYGHEIDRSTNPFEARLGWVVSLNKAAFVGREALRSIKVQGPTRTLVGLLVGEGGVPRPEYPLVATNGTEIGRVTSGTFSPTLRRSIALGYLPASDDGDGTEVAVQVRGRRVPARVSALPFVPNRARPRARIPAPAR
ncbi:MAG: glycine cleavage system aminomethyltransferase GcvT [Chloroflexi bacterium]|nr:glycine cleavage system aminomethyltransferase GcvT [Chloroflexota bacterium]